MATDGPATPATLRFRTSAAPDLSERRFVPYELCRDKIRSGDWLLWRPTSLLGRAICWGTESPYSHASMAGWSRDDRLRNVEMIQFRGGRTILLSEQLTQWPGACDVYRPRYPAPSTSFGYAALHQMLWLCGQNYGWRDFGRITLRTFTRYLQRMLPPAANTSDPDQPRVCSASVAFAARTGGQHPAMQDLLDLEVLPGDLASPLLASYLFTPVMGDDMDATEVLT